jgi:tetratricopeptide (TPR) repeat protein
MNRSLRFWLLGLTITSSMLSFWAWTDAVSSPASSGKKKWQISGRVSSLQGEPLAGVSVKLEAENSAKGPRMMATNLKGEFQTEIVVDPAKFSHLQGTLVASKTGYAEGREIVDLYLDSSASGIDIILCKLNEGEDQLPIARLVRILAPQLKNSAAKAFAEEAGKTEFVRGYEELMDRQNPAAAIPLFEKSVERTPECIECQLLLGLALLHAGRWSAAGKQIENTNIVSDLFETKPPELPLMKGILEAWQGHVNEAVGLYENVLEEAPQNALALQELGRVAVAQKKWDTAEQFLSRALQTGASEDARLLRVRALLELGIVEEALDEMNRYAAGRDIKDLPQSARTLNEKVQNQLSLLSKGPVKSMTTQSVEELLQALPELQGLETAADQSPLEEVLNRAGEAVAAFFQAIPDTASLEKVRQERLKKDGKVATSLDQEFQYIMLAQNGEPGLGISEYRSTEDGRDAVRGGLKQGLMLTSGFASVLSIFHPVNRKDSDFRYLGKQKLDGQEVHVVAFAQKPETAKMVTRFVAETRSALAIVHGLAWVDAHTFHILRLHTYLLNPLPTVQLLELSTEIQFQEVSFQGLSKPFWLPKDVQITVNWRGRLLHNQHRYSDFKLFNVEAKEEKKPVLVPAPPPAESSESKGRPNPKTALVQ